MTQLGTHLEQQQDLAGLIPNLRALANRAAVEILDVYSRDVDVTLKSDDSPLTEADLRAHRVICAGLESINPRWPVLSEESKPVEYAKRKLWDTYWLVDPLDGTREFVSRNGEFTINIALIIRSRPVLGLVQIPVQDLTYVGHVGVGAWRAKGEEPLEPIHVAKEVAPSPRVLGSRSHRGDSLNAFLERVKNFQLIGAGSSLKFCQLAEGLADVYPRLGPTSEWDTAAGQALLEAAGGYVVTLDGQPLRYNTKAELLNPHFLAGIGDPNRWLDVLHTP